MTYILRFQALSLCSKNNRLMKNYFSDEVDQNELIEAIQSHFGRSEHLKKQLTFYNEDKSEVLVIGV